MMAETGAVFGGEHSAHYYFARNYCADSGLIATMRAVDELSRGRHDLSKVRASRSSATPQSGEINTHVDDVDRVLADVSGALSGGRQDHLDSRTMRRARSRGLSRSLAAPVVRCPKTSSSATRPPMAMQMRSSM